MNFINYATLNKINNKTSVTGKYHVPIIKRSDINVWTRALYCSLNNF